MDWKRGKSRFIDFWPYPWKRVPDGKKVNLYFCFPLKSGKKNLPLVNFRIPSLFFTTFFFRWRKEFLIHVFVLLERFEKLLQIKQKYVQRWTKCPGWPFVALGLLVKLYDFDWYITLGFFNLCRQFQPKHVQFSSEIKSNQPLGSIRTHAGGQKTLRFYQCFHVLKLQ